MTAIDTHQETGSVFDTPWRVEYPPIVKLRKRVVLRDVLSVLTLCLLLSGLLVFAYWLGDSPAVFMVLLMTLAVLAEGWSHLREVGNVFFEKGFGAKAARLVKVKKENRLRRKGGVRGFREQSRKLEVRICRLEAGLREARYILKKTHYHPCTLDLQQEQWDTIQLLNQLLGDDSNKAPDPPVSWAK